MGLTRRANLTSSVIGAVQNPTPSDPRVKAQVNILELEINKIKAVKGNVVSFGNLSFGNFGDARAWLETSCQNGKFGFIVDFHTVMEHIHQQITGADSLKQMGQVYKLSLTTIAEAVQMTSFEVSSPRFLTASGAHHVLGNKASYFSYIKTYDNWEEPNNGFKLRLKTELEAFRAHHTETITNSLAPSHPLHNLALASLTESVNWVYGLLNYIDQTYSQYSTGKFGPEKSWHITTKLAVALMVDIATPRQGVSNSFEAGKPKQIASVIFYSVLRSLDKMIAIKKLDYKNAPAVNTELVKFLSLNTSFEAVDKLVISDKLLNSDIMELKKGMAVQTKALSTVGNKLDTLMTTVADLKKRIIKLESK